MNPYLTLLKSLLKAVDCEVDASGKVLRTMGDKTKPLVLKVGEERRDVYLPLKSVIDKGDFTKIAVFHPAAEELLRGQSEMLNMLMDLMEFKLFHTTQTLAVTLAALSVTSNTQLPVAQSRLLDDIPPFSKTTLAYLERTVKKCTGTHGKYPLFSLRLKRIVDCPDGYMRTCEVINHVPDEGRIFDLSTNVASETKVASLYKFIFDIDTYVGSGSSDAPYLISLVNCFVTIAERLNEITQGLTALPGIREQISLSGLSKIEEIKKIARDYVPQTLPFNGGSNEIIKLTDVDSTEEVPESTIVAPKAKEEYAKVDVAGYRARQGQQRGTQIHHNPHEQQPYHVPQRQDYVNRQPSQQQRPVTRQDVRAYEQQQYARSTYPQRPQQQQQQYGIPNHGYAPPQRPSYR